MSQATEFLSKEGDAWFERNRDKLAKNDVGGDLLITMIKESDIQPKSVLEIGCGTGWRLDEMRKRYGASCTGIEPSRKALEHGHKYYPQLSLYQGLAHHIRFGDNTFDLVIYGFCLYLVDPQWLFYVVAEGDRVLKDGGHLAILDFEFDEDAPFSVPYEHAAGLKSNHMDFSALWTAHPGYKWLNHTLGNGHEATLLRKDMSNAFPVRS